MSRTRTIYNSEALFVGPAPATGSHFGTGGNNLLNQLIRVQSANHNLNIAREDANEFGVLAAIDRVILNPPTVTLDYSYLINSLSNEAAIGMTTNGSGSMLTNIMNGTAEPKNYFILEVPDGSDAVAGDGNPALNGVHGFGNGYLSSISWQGQVGQFPRATVQVQAFNYKVDVSSSGNNIPAINITNGTLVTGYTYTIPPTITGDGVSVLRPGDITLSISGAIGYNVPALNLQSFNLSVQLNRHPIQKLGSLFPFARVIQFPINATLQVDAIVSDLAYGNLADVLCNDINYNLFIYMKNPACSGTGTVAIQYSLLGAKLDTQNSSSSIGPENTLQMTWLSPLGGPNDTVHNLLISGVTYVEL